MRQHQLQDTPVKPLTITLKGEDLGHFREMVRQQLLGDMELMRDILAGREEPGERYDIGRRIEFVRGLARELGLPEHPDRRREPRITVPRPKGAIRRRLVSLLMSLLSDVGRH